MSPNPSLGDWLSHPLLLLIVGALISTYLIPFLTRRWQNHQKELELKTSLVREINDYLMGMIMKIEFVEMYRVDAPPERFNKAFENMQSYYMDWMVKKEVIGSNIRAFFPKKIEIASEWDHLTNAVYLLEGLSEIPFTDEISYTNTRKTYLQSIQKRLSESLGSGDWDKLADRLSQNWLNNWLSVKQLIASRKVELVREIVKTRISGF